MQERTDYVDINENTEGERTVRPAALLDRENKKENLGIILSHQDRKYDYSEKTGLLTDKGGN